MVLELKGGGRVVNRGSVSRGSTQGGGGGAGVRQRGSAAHSARGGVLPAGLLCARYRASMASRLLGGPSAVNKLEHTLLHPCTLTATHIRPNTFSHPST